jgi:nitrogen fixation NifU-like protein
MSDFISGLVLAAGTSSRLGEKTKQLLPWKGTTLVEWVIRQAEGNLPNAGVGRKFSSERRKNSGGTGDLRRGRGLQPRSFYFRRGPGGGSRGGAGKPGGISHPRRRYPAAVRQPRALSRRRGNSRRLPGEIAHERHFNQFSFALLLAHAAKHDLPVLDVLLRTEVRYIGVLGSTQRAAALGKKLKEMGFSDKDIGRIQIPVGSNPRRIGYRGGFGGADRDLDRRRALDGAHRPHGESLARGQGHSGFRVSSESYVALYSEKILDHASHPRKFGRMENPDSRFEEYNPLCGDRIRVELRIAEDGAVLEALFSGEMCAIAKGSASILLESIEGMKGAAIGAISDAHVLGSLGGPIESGRLKCALLPLAALRGAILGVSL